MPSTLHTTSRVGGLSVKTTRGDGSVRLGIDLSERPADPLAPLPVPCPKAESRPNRLGRGTRDADPTTANDGGDTMNLAGTNDGQDGPRLRGLSER